MIIYVISCYFYWRLGVDPSNLGGAELLLVRCRTVYLFDKTGSLAREFNPFLSIFRSDEVVGVGNSQRWKNRSSGLLCSAASLFFV